MMQGVRYTHAAGRIAAAAGRQALANPLGAYRTAVAATRAARAAVRMVGNLAGNRAGNRNGGANANRQGNANRGKYWGPGKSSGKFRVKRKPRLRKQRRALKNGVEQVRESVGSHQALYCTYTGHASQPVNMVKELMWLAIAKRVSAILTRGSSTSVDEPIQQLNAGKVIQWSYRTNPAAAPTQRTITVPVATTWTIRTLAQALSVDWELTNPTDQFQLISVASNGISGTQVPFFLNLTNAKLDIYAKSTLKLQNRTQSRGTDGDEEGDVDNVPTYGKAYQCSGNGTTYIGDNNATVGAGGNVPMQANNTTGLFKLSVDVQNDLSEPPSAIPFLGVKKYDKIRLEPGHIKTSTLVDRYTISIQKLIGLFGTVGAFNPTFKKIGKFRMFALEKIMETAEPPTVPIIIGYEHQVRMSCALVTAAPSTRTMFVAFAG